MGREWIRLVGCMFDVSTYVLTDVDPTVNRVFGKYIVIHLSKLSKV